VAVHVRRTGDPRSTVTDPDGDNTNSGRRCTDRVATLSTDPAEFEATHTYEPEASAVTSSILENCRVIEYYNTVR
jgi:hypothetical protein